MPSSAFFTQNGGTAQTLRASPEDIMAPAKEEGNKLSEEEMGAISNESPAIQKPR